MAVPMASASLASQLSCSALKAPSCPLPAYLVVKQFSFLQKRRFLHSAAIITPRALSVTTLEMNSLKNLGLNVVKENVFLDASGKHNKFAITKADTGRKVHDPELLEAIRLAIINNMLEYHPESSAQLAMGAALGALPQAHQVDVDIATHVNVNDDGVERSLLYVETADRPGLLVELVKAVTDTNVAVESGEFDTEGLLAKAKFHVSYRGKALIKPLQQMLANSLRYFLRLPSTEEESS